MNQPDRLSLRVQIGYATADVGLNAAEFLVRIYVLAFYTDVVGLGAGLAGLAAAIAVVWDAVTDPVMGVVSDRTRHRLGGRRGWLPPGGVLLALGTAAVFWPPVELLATQGAKFAWLLGAYCFLNTGMTVLSVPYMAMAGEMTEDPHGRAVLFGWRFAFANVGVMLAAALPALFLGGGDGIARAMPGVSLVLALVVVATAALSWRSTARVRFLMPPLPPQSVAGAFAAPFRSAPFRPLLAAYIAANFGIGVNAATFVYYYQHVLALSAARTQTVLVVFMAVFTVSILGWVELAKRREKRRLLVLGAAVLGVGTTALYVLAPAGGFWWVLALGAVGLGAFVGCIVLIDAMLTDVIDHDRLRTRQLSSGGFFGVWRFAGKLVRAGSLATVGLVLGAAGFVERGGAQPPAVGAALVWLFGPVVGASFLLTAAILWRYRFGAREQQRVRALLLRRGTGAAGPRAASGAAMAARPGSD